MTDDPKNFRYDQSLGHKTPPAGLQPVVSETPVGVPPKKTLTEEQQERRKQLLTEMKSNIAKSETEKPTPPDKNNLPYDVELTHPAAKIKPEPESENENAISKYRMSLSKALETPDMKSIRYGVVGTGQCGGRLAEIFARFGYPVCVINTAQQDLAYLDIPDQNKLFMSYALGGAGKNLLVGQQAASENQAQIGELLTKTMSVGVDQILVCIGGGGGSGGGSVVPLLQAIMETKSISGLPVVVIFTLPMNDEGAAAKANAVKTLERIAAMVNDNIISSLIIVDNAKIQEHYPNVSIKDFWELANFDIVNHFNMFNTVSKCATKYDALDPMDFASIVSTGGCLIYGRVEVPVEKIDGQYQVSESLLADALIKGATEGTLAEGFDIKQAVSLGIIITSSEDVLSQIPAVNVNYACNMLAEHVGQDCSQYRGLYVDDTARDAITVYTIFAGLGLPSQRVNALKEEAEQALQKIEAKKKVKLSLTDTGSPQTSSLHSSMKQKNTPLGRMIDRRRGAR
jgi:cell division GTPase FtsZ